MNLFGKSRKRIFLHVGADKCGSSSIQYFLSQNKNLKNNVGENMDYMCIIPPGKIITQPEISDTSQKIVQNFLNSNFAFNPCNLSKNLSKNISESMRKKINNKKNLIFSSEGWLRNIHERNNFCSFLNFFNAKVIYDIKVFAVVRSPASWINSAWWQWGVWDKNYQSFEDWLEFAITQTNWFRYLSKYFDNPMIESIKIVTLEDNLINNFIKFLNLEEDINYRSNPTNFSLDKNFYKVLLSIEDYKLNNKKEKDFFFCNHLFNSYKFPSETPWVLNQNHLTKIIKKTEKANKKLLTLLSNESRKNIVNNSEWWDSTAFSKKNLSDPYLNDFSLDKNLTMLIYQLFKSNQKGFDFISSKSLQKEYLDYLSL